MMYERLPHEINLQYKINDQNVNGILHSYVDYSYDKVIFIVPGIYGDRCDSRAMYVQLARRLVKLGYSVVRFDYVGGGVNLGDYTLNDFEYMTETCIQFIYRVCEQFSWLKELGLIGFSEGGKICVRVSNRINIPISYIGFCNAILVEEALILPIKRPKVVNNRLAYDSEIGLWTSFNIVEDYKKWFIQEAELASNIVYAGVYSNDDPLSASSRAFLCKQGVLISYVYEGDHLFTKASACTEMMSLWEKRLASDWPVEAVRSEQEYYISYLNDRICVKVIFRVNATKTFLYVHGLGQNKSGPSFLYTNIAYDYQEMNHVLFDFKGSGDSSGGMSNMTLSCYVQQLSFMIDYTKKLFCDTDIILVGSGTGNIYISECFSAKNYKKVLFHPEYINVWNLLSLEEKKLKKIDTFLLFSEYNWAEEEFLKMGNVFNRTSGIMINMDYLKSITEARHWREMAIDDSNTICVTNESEAGNGNIYVKDNSYLLMSAKLRWEVIRKLKNFF